MINLFADIFFSEETSFNATIEPTWMRRHAQQCDVQMIDTDLHQQVPSTHPIGVSNDARQMQHNHD